jgi:hypothetical protein
MALVAQGNFLGGNNATDYQPPTRNPQGDTANLNQTGGNLQPQSSTTQTTLPSVDDLRVPGVNGSPNTNTTKTAAPSTNRKQVNFWPIGIIGVLTLIAMVYVIAQPDPTKRRRPAVATETVPEPIVKKQITKKKPTKKTHTKKKSARKRR